MKVLALAFLLLSISFCQGDLLNSWLDSDSKENSASKTVSSDSQSDHASGEASGEDSECSCCNSDSWEHDFDKYKKDVTKAAKSEYHSVSKDVSSAVDKVEKLFGSMMSAISQEIPSTLGDDIGQVENEIENNLKKDMPAVYNCGYSIYNNSEIFKQIEAIQNQPVELIILWNKLRAELANIAAGCALNVSNYGWLTNPEFNMSQTLINDAKCYAEIVSIVDDCVFIANAEADPIGAVVHLISLVKTGDQAYEICSKDLEKLEPKSAKSSSDCPCKCKNKAGSSSSSSSSSKSGEASSASTSSSVSSSTSSDSSSDSW